MADAKSELYFRPERTSRIFPVDCSRDELCNALNCHRNTSDKFHQLPVFRDVLLQQALSPQYDDTSVLPKDTYVPLPLEILPLLKASFDITKRGSDRELRQVLLEPDSATEETWAEFLAQLHHRLEQDNAPFPDIADPEASARFRHLLFRDEAFTQTMLDDIWDDAFQERYNQLRELAHNFPSGVQAQVLANCLTALDESYHYLLFRDGQPAPKKPSPASADLLTGLLQAILSHRSTYRAESGNNPQAAYRLPDTCPIPERTWAEVFRSLRKATSDAEPLRQAREAYFKSEFLPSEAPEAEQEYDRLRFFLDPTPFAVSEPELNAFLTSLCREQAMAIIRRFLLLEHQPPEPITPPFPWQQYLGYSLNRTIQEQISAAFTHVLGSFDESIQLATALSANQGFYIQYELLESAYESATKTRLPLEDPRSLQWMISRFLEYLDRAWRFLHPADATVRDSETGLIYPINHIADIFSSDGRTAIDFFGLAQEPALAWYSAQELASVFESFNQTLTEITPRPINVYLHLSNLMPGLLIAVLHRIVLDTVPTLMDRLRTRYPKIDIT